MARAPDGDVVIDPADWASIKSIFHAVVDAPAGERAALLDQLTVGNPALRPEVEALLQADARTSGAFDQLGGALMGPHDPMLGRTVGAYGIERELGHGGMGTVYLARRTGSFEQRVALKIVRRGMDTAHVLARFMNERQILAGLDHPHIARLLDGGSTDDGLPYFVMEYLDGIPVSEYCDQHQLPIDARLRLFLVVCDAVHYAHQHLIVHRDLKPTNVLVTAEGVPKLLDFGIAKLLGPDAGDTPALTAVNLRVMTPAYAAPEQLNGEPVTTATDVYALGVLLHELLTGTRPQSMMSPNMRALTGELDAIVRMAMRTEPERRYGSAEQLSGDIGRYLHGQPVLAQPDTWRYRTGKFLKRNRGGVSAAAVVLASIIAGAGAALWQARVARLERARAERRFADVQALAHALIFDIHDALDQGPLTTRQLLVTRAMTYLDRLTPDAGNDVTLQHELASAYQRLASIQGTGLTAGQLGDAAAARASYDKARALQMRVLAAAPFDFESRREIAHLDWLDGFSSLSDGKPQLAIEQLRRSAAALEALRAERPADDKTPEYLTEVYYGLVLAYGSDTVAGVGNEPATVEFLKAGIDLAEYLAAEQPGNSDRASTLASFYGRQAERHEGERQYAEARKVRDQGLKIREQLLARNPHSALLQRELATTLGNFGTLDIATRDYPAMLQHTRRALPIFQTLADLESDNLNAHQDLAVGERNLGRALTLNNRADEATGHFDKAVQIFEALGTKKPGDAFVARQIAFTHLVSSANVNALRGPAAAIEEARKGIPICERLISLNPKNATAWRTYAQIVTEAAVYSRQRAERGPTSLWQDARTWYTRSRDAWAGVQKATGSLTGPDAKRLENAEKGIADATAALERAGNFVLRR